MKILALLAAGSLIVLPAYAQDVPDQPDEPPTESEIIGSPMAELGYMLQCMASEANLMHLRLQAAASITALSAPTMQSQLATLVASYNAMADDDEKREDMYRDVIKTAIIPHVTSKTITAEVATQQAQTILDHSVAEIASLIGNPANSLDSQIMIEKLLIEQSSACETMAQKVIAHNTI
jgi:hypothetical protein